MYSPKGTKRREDHTNNRNEAVLRLYEAAQRRLQTTSAFLDHTTSLRPFSEFEETRRLKAQMDAADEEWRAAYDELERIATQGQRSAEAPLHAEVEVVFARREPPRLASSDAAARPAAL